MRRQLAVDRMGSRALWDRARVLIGQAHPLQNRGPKDLEVTLYGLQAVLNELEARGQQLTLVPEPDPGGHPDEQVFGLKH
jgi:hypothetical protein